MHDALTSVLALSDVHADNALRPVPAVSGIALTHTDTRVTVPENSH